MKNKILNLGVISIIVSFLALGFSQESQAYEILNGGNWKDGTYLEIAQGRYGEFEVTVVIEDGKIKDILVGEHNETPDIGGVAIRELPPRIIEQQSAEVDVVSGATITSNALKDAVARVLEKASVNNEQQ